MKRCIGSAKPHTIVFSLFITMLKKWLQRISWYWENIWAQNRPIIMKNWIFDEKVHRIRKTSHNRFSLFRRYYDAEGGIHKRISWNWENISKSGPKIRPIIMKNWIFDEKVHRIRKTSHNRFSLFRKILRCWRVIHKRISWNWENISKSGPKVRPIIMKNWIFDEKVHRIRKTSHNRFSLFRKDITMLKKYS